MSKGVIHSDTNQRLDNYFTRAYTYITRALAAKELFRPC